MQFREVYEVPSSLPLRQRPSKSVILFLIEPDIMVRVLGNFTDNQYSLKHTYTHVDSCKSRLNRPEELINKLQNPKVR